MPEVRVILDGLRSLDTEDWTGKDDVYFAGVVTAGEHLDKVLTRPVAIDEDSGTLKLGFDAGTVFRHEVPDDALLKIALIAFEEDSGQAWARRSEALERIGAAVSAVVSRAGKRGAAAGAIVEAVSGAIGAVGSLDDDDELGHMQEEFEVRDIRPGETPLFHDFRQDRGLSSWHYRLHYRLVKR